MNDIQKMLQAIIHGQNSLKQELVGKIDKLGERLDGRIDGLENKIDRVEENLTKRIDNIGRQLAYLEDDTPTREEFNGDHPYQTCITTAWVSMSKHKIYC